MSDGRDTPGERTPPQSPEPRVRSGWIGALLGLAGLSAAASLVLRPLFLVSAAILLVAAEVLGLRIVGANPRAARRVTAGLRAGSALLAMLLGVLPGVLSRVAGGRSRILDVPQLPPPVLAVAGAVLLGGCFAGLVAERRLSALALGEAGWRPALLPMRGALAGAALVGTALVAGAGGLPLARWAQAAAGVVVLGTALDRLLLGALALVMPASGATSDVRAAALDLGIDLSRSWGLRFARAILPAIAVAVTGLLWLSAGLTVVGPDERIIARRFGRTVGVVGPGLHVDLPPPFGSSTRIEYGRLHELTLGDAATPRPVAPQVRAPGADDDASADLDRLWNAAHTGEIALLIASGTPDRRTVEAVACDLTLVWRLGLSDAAALAAASGAADPESLVRTTARRDVARLFAGQTLEAVLGGARNSIEGRLRADMQADLDRLGTGLEMVAVVVEAVHPPPDAAEAYHGVQVAGILAETALENARGSAVSVLGQARQNADSIAAAAQAGAAETVSVARRDGVALQAARTAATVAGPAFGLEARFEHLATGLSRLPLLVVDHRLDARQLPTIDLRPTVSAPDAAPHSEE